MSKIHLLSKTVNIEHGVEYSDYKINLKTKYSEGQAPELIHGRATCNAENENSKPHWIDFSYYPATGNIQFTSHNSPEELDPIIFSKIIEFSKEILGQSN